MDNARRVAATQGLAIVSGGAGAIHLAVIGEHAVEGLLFGAFFSLVGAFQLGWALLMLRGPSKPLYMAGAIGNAVVLSIWAVSRSTGLPIGPGGGIPEPVGFIDGVATTYEAVIVGGTMSLLQPSPAGPRPTRGRTRRLVGWGVAGSVSALTALSLLFPGSSHDVVRVIAHSHGTMQHHRLHVLVLGAVGVVFLVFLAFHMWEKGWQRDSAEASR